MGLGAVVGVTAGQHAVAAPTRRGRGTRSASARDLIPHSSQNQAPTLATTRKILTGPIAETVKAAGQGRAQTGAQKVRATQACATSKASPNSPHPHAQCTGRRPAGSRPAQTAESKQNRDRWKRSGAWAAETAAGRSASPRQTPSPGPVTGKGRAHCPCPALHQRAPDDLRA